MWHFSVEHIKLSIKILFLKSLHILCKFILIITYLLPFTYLFLDVEDLYSEVIYCILHMIGNDAPDESMRFQFIEHLRKAFRVDPQKHILLYEKAASRDKPMVKMNLCVLEAKELAWYVLILFHVIYLFFANNQLFF